MVKSMSDSRLVVLRDLLSLSQQEFASRIGITQGALSQLESQKSKLSLDSLLKINRVFGVDCNWLVTGEGEIFYQPSGSEPQSMDNGYQISREGYIPLIRGEAHAGYIENYLDEKYLDTLEVYKIPGYETGGYRLFEVEGDSMTPSIYPGEIVVCERLPDTLSIENGALCIVVAEEGIVAKRTYVYEEDRNMLILKSDNTDYKTYSIPMDSVREVWRVRAKITNVFVQPQVVDSSKLRELEADIMTLKAEMSRLSAEKPSPSTTE